MFKSPDPYTFFLTANLKINSGENPTVIGSFSAEYQVMHYEDVQLKSGVPQSGKCSTERKYVLSLTQRVRIFNREGLNISPKKTAKDADRYLNYPALISVPANIIPSENLYVDLIDYSPKTLNTKVHTAGTAASSTGGSSTSTTSSTIGSSTSQTNSYGATVGITGDVFGASVSTEYSYSSAQDRSSTSGAESSRSNSNENSQSVDMSVKDWGAYCLVNPNTNSPVWTFGQEFPWDAIECRHTDEASFDPIPNQVRLYIPNAMIARIYDGTVVYPPSHLSMFGIDFVMKAQWKVTVPNGCLEKVNINHAVDYFSGSHLVRSGSVIVGIDSKPASLEIQGTASSDFSTTDIDLGVLALAPITNQSGPGLVGFIPSKFTILPKPPEGDGAPTHFKLFSVNNNLRITDNTLYGNDQLGSSASSAGFVASQTALTATPTHETPLTMRVLFKIVDSSADYVLYMKHWKVGNVGVMLKFVINGDEDNALIKYVDSIEAEGGEANLLSISLRNQNIQSVDYHDYLTLGLNSIDITISPIEGDAATYKIRALSIEAV